MGLDISVPSPRQRKIRNPRILRSVEERPAFEVLPRYSMDSSDKERESPAPILLDAAYQLTQKLHLRKALL
jgi:hypothetical protein